MRITLTVVAGPHKGLEFSFARHDTFLVGRSRHAHFRLASKDKYFSRLHFMVEVNPPKCRIIDMGSRNGTYVNGARLLHADLCHGDEIRAGHTVLKLSVLSDSEADLRALELADSSSRLAEPVEDPGAPAFPEVPGYHIRSELGKGALGIVYLATRVADNKRVALKAIAPAVFGSPAHIEDFLGACGALAELEHPHIVRFRERGWAGGVLYFAMEYVRGLDAGAALAKEGPFAIKRAVRLTCHVLEALAYAHAKQMVHCDIKPSNVLIAQKEGQEIAKLSDFGLARVYQDSLLSGVTMTVHAGASAGFMPPERITDYQSAAPAADQYAVAATLYTLLTGQHVFDLPTEIHRQYALILKAQPVPIRERRQDIGAGLAAVIHKALARQPAQRFGDVAQFRIALKREIEPA